MDPELATLATTAATTLVASLTTDAWERAKTAVGGLWRRVHPEGSDTVEAELVQVRAEVLAARKADDQQAEQALVSEWQARLRRLLTTDPWVADELRHIVDDLTPMLPGGDRVRIGRIQMTATASGHGRIYQAGRDQSIADG